MRLATRQEVRHHPCGGGSPQDARRPARCYSYCFMDELVRISTARLKVESGPAKWRSTSQVLLDAAGFAMDVRLVDVCAIRTHGGKRR